MGYTHYFQLHNKPSKEGWISFIKGAENLIAQAWDTSLEVEIGEDFISINGVGEESHETFFFSKVSKEWEFCKTARKPYDKVVTSVLILAKYLFPTMYLKSDGNWEEWIEGRELFKEVFYLEPAENTVFDSVEAKHGSYA
jgi:hypothetical protein